jgi:hypothetical protein
MTMFFRFLLSLVISSSCFNKPKQDWNNAKIEYEASSRGYYSKIIIEKRIISISKERNSILEPEVKNINTKDWNYLVTCLKKVNLKKLQEYKDPTQDRFFDGAPIGSLKINYKGKEYQSVSFDHGTPPVEIEKLVSKIISLAEINNGN